MTSAAHIQYYKARLQIVWARAVFTIPVSIRKMVYVVDSMLFTKKHLPEIQIKC